ncbi:MAG TPA: MBL fold metallo-hydrolase [Sedimentisphaerales bacterium]|nr:MBL fold metallo-hydrolase [Sedimentisphaerales bacterium]HRS09899.1 MBL fold metallo-hydrolase [Sedimentisphaerales bacterium]HRV46451.1 MBL fold metallo-hydrolase [Sedimentisphaerales bacterium]
MKIDRLILGDFQTNCYVVRADESARECLVIDTGLDSRDMIAFLTRQGLTPRAVILTHGHVDHIAGLAALRSRFPGLRVYIHKLDGRMLADSQANLSEMAMLPFETEAADVLLEDGDTVQEAGIVLKVLHTPGHTPGGICLYAETEGVVFAGDTLFADGVGRTDFPGGDWDQLLHGIRTKLLALPEQTAVYPGHGMRTTIGREKASNPFLR